MEIEDTSVGVTAERKGRWGDTRHGHAPTFGTFFTFSASSASVRAATAGGDTRGHTHTEVTLSLQGTGCPRAVAVAGVGEGLVLRGAEDLHPPGDPQHPNNLNSAPQQPRHRLPRWKGAPPSPAEPRYSLCCEPTARKITFISTETPSATVPTSTSFSLEQHPDTEEGG